MKFLLKKTLLAASVAVAFGASAGDVAVTKQVHSKEGLTGVTAGQTSNTISYDLAAAYRDGDKITFTFPDGALVSNGFPSQINVAAVNNAVEADAIAGLALGLLNSTDSSVTYRVTSVTQPTDGLGTTYTNRTTIGNTLVLGTVQYTPAAVLAGAVTVTVTSQTSVGDVLDSQGTRTATLAESKSQFGTVEVTESFDNVIDVSAMRKSFVGNLTDSMTYEITNPTTTGWLNLASVTETEAVVNGESGKLAGVTSADFTTGGTAVFAEDEAKLTVTYAGLTTTDTITFTAPTGTDALVLETQDFVTDYVYSYTSAAAVAGSKTVGLGVNAGEWTLNGSTVNVPYMPYGPNVSQIMYITNDGTQSGDIMVTAFDDKGNMYDLGVVGTAAANTVTKITRLVNDGLLAAGFNGTKASITVTVNAPDSDITVYAGYNVGGSDRGFVNTSQYKGK